MDARALVFTGRLAPVVAAALPLLPAPPALVLQVGDGDGGTVPGAQRYEAALASAAPLAPGTTRPSSDDLVMICTGGTTGTPKGVLWASREFFVTSLRGHELLDAAAEPTPGAAIDVALAEEPPRSICTTALVHFAAQAVALQALVRGGTALVLPTDTGFSAAEFVRLVEEERATDGMLIGDTLGAPIADALAVGTHDTSSLRFLTAGSALLSVATKRRLLDEVPHLEIRDSLGASETGLQAIARATADRIEESFTLLPGNDVLDDDGHPLAPGAPEPGSLARVEHVARGYYRDEAATARVFRDGPLGRFAVTGDAVRKGADGTVALLGREATCINTGGEKVFAEEVERVLLAHDAVADCLVVGVPSARWGHEVRALVVGRDRPIDGSALDAHARGALAGYKVPKRYIAVGRIERLVSGKPDYRWARERATC
jgi:acyl-CoA synthetase (AMP-forming)/AMP-acid ligase II